MSPSLEWVPYHKKSLLGFFLCPQPSLPFCHGNLPHGVDNMKVLTRHQPLGPGLQLLDLRNYKEINSVVVAL